MDIRNGTVEIHSLNERVWRVATIFDVKENSNDRAKLALRALVLMNNVHLEIMMLSTHGVL